MNEEVAKMNRTLISLVCVLLVALLVLPAVAYATPGNGKGNGKAASGIEESGVAQGKGKAKGKDKSWKGGHALEEEAGDPGGTEEPEDGEEPEPSAEDESGPLSGIANALSRIQANIAKAEAKVEAGTKRQVPPGLLKVMAKFMAWLGIAPEEPDVPEDPAPEEPDEPGDDDSEVPTGTVEPDPIPEDGAPEFPVEPTPAVD